MGENEINAGIRRLQKQHEEMRMRLYGALSILAVDGIISEGRARELAGMTPEQQREYIRCAMDEDGGSWLHGRCPSCGHRLAFASDSCPQCCAHFGAYAPVDYPELCKCERCESVRSGEQVWIDPALEGETECAD